MNENFASPRWPGGPPICITANLCAFEGKAAAAKFRDANCPGFVVLAEWQCKACGYIHYWVGAPGDSNGGSLTGSRTIPERIVKLIQQTRLSST